MNLKWLFKMNWGNLFMVDLRHERRNLCGTQRFLRDHFWEHSSLYRYEKLLMILGEHQTWIQGCKFKSFRPCCKTSCVIIQTAVWKQEDGCTLETCNNQLVCTGGSNKVSKICTKLHARITFPRIWGRVSHVSTGEF